MVTSVLVARPQQVAQPSPTPVLYKPIVVEQVDVIRHGSTADVVARLRNPNPRAGVVEYPVTFVLFNNNNQEFHQRQETTYVLPGSVHYVVALEVPVTQPLLRVEVTVPEAPAFRELPPTIDIPTFASFSRQSVIRSIGEQVVEEQKWIIRNTSTFDFQRVEVLALAHASNERVVGVGTTLVGALRVGEQREVTIQWPAPAEPTARVTVFPSTNIFLEENIIRAIGDPGSLQ